MHLSANMFLALQWNIEPPLPAGENDDSVDRIILQPFSKEILAVSQDVVKSPDEVSFIKNLQVWTFRLIPESDQVYT